MKKLVLIIIFLSIICFVNCQLNNNDNVENQDDSIFAYDEHVNIKNVLYNGDKYDIIAKVLNEKNGFVRHKDQKYYDREILITLQNKEDVKFEK